MYRVIFSPRSRSQLNAIFHYLSREASKETALSYTESITEECGRLSIFPHRGSLHNEIRPGMRIFGFRRRVAIAFEVVGDEVRILGIYYGGQNYKSLLSRIK